MSSTMGAGRPEVELDEVRLWVVGFNDRKSTPMTHIPLYLYPFLNTTSKSRPVEYLRLTSLGIIGALVKVDDTEVISFLLSTEIIPLCLRTMEMGSELSKTLVVETFIVQKILLDDVGLEYICTTAERFFVVGRVLANMVAALAEQPSSRILKHIIRCYLRLSDNPSACDALRSCLPDMIRVTTFNSCLRIGTFKAYQIAKGRPKQTHTLSWNNENELNGTTTSYLEEEINEIRDVVADYLIRNLQK
ncbi:CCR4-NOT transcription complex subunit 9 [Orobanche hederae]